MTKEEAELQLQVVAQDDPESIVEAYSTKCFEIRTFLFRTPLVPQLALKRAQKLWKLHMAVTLLVDNTLLPPRSSAAMDQKYRLFEQEFSRYEPQLHLEKQVEKMHAAFFCGQTNHHAAIVSFEQQEQQLKLLFSNAYLGNWMSFFLEQWAALELAFYQRLLSLEQIELDHAQPNKQSEKCSTIQLRAFLSDRANKENEQQLMREWARMNKALQMSAIN